MIAQRVKHQSIYVNEGVSNGSPGSEVRDDVQGGEMSVVGQKELVGLHLSEMNSRLRSS